MNKGRIAAAVSAGVLALAAPVVTHFEGLENDPYRDVAGVWSVCYGDTYGIQRRRYSDAECTQRLMVRLAEHDADLLRCVTRPIPDHVHAALLSWTYNVGAAKACGSTLMRKLNAGDTLGACAELSRWTMAAGQVQPGLVRRRAAERELCEGQ